MDSTITTRLTLDVDSLTVTSFEPDEVTPAVKAAATMSTLAACCGTGCNTRLTCSTSLC